jgi:hypothetical protein
MSGSFDGSYEAPEATALSGVTVAASRPARPADADQSIRWAKFTMNPSGPRTDAMRQTSSY